MSVTQPDVYEAVRGYVQSAIRVLANDCPEPDVVPPYDERWVRQGRNFVRISDAPRVTWVRCIHRLGDKLHSLNEFHQLQHVLEAHPIIGPQLGQLVGTELGQSAMHTDIHRLSDGFLVDLIDEKQALDMDENVLQRIYEANATDLMASEFVRVTVVPIHGIEIPIQRIAFDSVVEIGQITDEEVQRCARVGAIRSRMPRPILEAPAVCIRVRERMQKLVGPARSEKEAQVAQNIFEKTTQLITETIGALTLAVADPIVALGEITFTEGYWHQGVTSFRFYANDPWAPPPARMLDAATTAQLLSVYRLVSSGRVRNQKPLQVALRRWLFATERSRADDQIVDLMIAGEALLLSDIDSRTRGELTYRLALRAGMLVNHPSHSAWDVFNFMRNAYGIRSAIVHGDREIAFRLMDGEKGDAAAFYKELADIMRWAMRRAMEFANRTGNYPPAWERMLLRSSS